MGYACRFAATRADIRGDLQNLPYTFVGVHRVSVHEGRVTSELKQIWAAAAVVVYVSRSPEAITWQSSLPTAV